MNPVLKQNIIPSPAGTLVSTVEADVATERMELRIVVIPAEISAEPTVEIQRWRVRSDAKDKRLRGGMRLDFHSAQKLREALKAIDAWHTAPNSEN